jgi:hypothetical protein
LKEKAEEQAGAGRSEVDIATKTGEIECKEPHCSFLPRIPKYGLEPKPKERDSTGRKMKGR